MGRDTIPLIADALGVDVLELVRNNALKDPNKIVTGDILTLKGLIDLTDNKTKTNANVSQGNIKITNDENIKPVEPTTTVDATTAISETTTEESIIVEPITTEETTVESEPTPEEPITVKPITEEPTTVELTTTEEETTVESQTTTEEQLTVEPTSTVEESTTVEPTTTEEETTVEQIKNQDVLTVEDARAAYNYVTFNNELLNLINKERLSLGLNILGFSPYSYDVITVPRVEQLENNGSITFYDQQGNGYGHLTLDITDASEVPAAKIQRIGDSTEYLTNIGVEKLAYAIANISFYQTDISNFNQYMAGKMYDMLFNSPGHRNNMLADSLQYYSVGLALSPYYREQATLYSYDVDSIMAVSLSTEDLCFKTEVTKTIEILNGI